MTSHIIIDRHRCQKSKHGRIGSPLQVRCLRCLCQQFPELTVQALRHALGHMLQVGGRQGPHIRRYAEGLLILVHGVW